jgi:Protein of unknown function (DUF642)
MKNYCIAALSAFALALTIGPHCHAAAFSNGSFESPASRDVSGSPGYQTLSAGSTDLSPWVIGMDSVDLLNVTNTIVVGAAYDGSQYVDLSGNAAGQLTQTFDTTPGNLYQFSFAYADNYTGPPTVHSATFRIYDTSGNVFAPTTIFHSTSMSGNLDWTLFAGVFLASDTTASIEFTSLDNTASGILLDDVVILEAIPETSTMMAALLTCAVLIGHALMRRRRA